MSLVSNDAWINCALICGLGLTYNPPPSPPHAFTCMLFKRCCICWWMPTHTQGFTLYSMSSCCTLCTPLYILFLIAQPKMIMTSEQIIYRRTTCTSQGIKSLPSLVELSSVWFSNVWNVYVEEVRRRKDFTLTCFSVITLCLLVCVCVCVWGGGYHHDD